jgi:HAD superfamily hydrolase (TIGR01509 family)
VPAFDFQPYSAVLFDVDGTVAETEGEGHLPAFNQAFAEFDIPWVWSSEEYGELLKVTGGFERIQSYAAKIGDAYALSEEGQAICLKIHKRKNELYAQRLATGLIPPRKGLTELIQSILDQGLIWGVVTTTSRANWLALWEHAVKRAAPNLPPPTIAVCGEDVKYKKPHSEAYQVALDHLGLPASACLAIEDSRNGLVAANGVGIDTVMVRSLFFGHQEFPEAVAVVNELSELV